MANTLAKEQKREHILFTAMEIFAQQGIHKTKVSDIAVAAGVGKGTLYEYFRSKEEIFLSAVSLWIVEFDQEVTKRMEAIVDPEEKLRIFISTVFEFYKSSFARLNITFEFWLEVTRFHHRQDHSDNIPNIQEKQTRYRHWLQSILEEGIQQEKFRPMNTEMVALIILSTFDGLRLQYVTQSYLFDFTEISKVVIETILNGIKL